jgi:hypothetical protein
VVGHADQPSSLSYYLAAAMLAAVSTTERHTPLCTTPYG